MKQLRYFKSGSPTCIDLINTNQESLLMKSCIFESGLSDYHKIIITILRKTKYKRNPKTT